MHVRGLLGHRAQAFDHLVEPAGLVCGFDHAQQVGELDGHHLGIVRGFVLFHIHHSSNIGLKCLGE